MSVVQIKKAGGIYGADVEGPALARYRQVLRL